ncbi:MAG: T9SS type A sorting domain-containing protein [Saprospiraceae bacterium]|nr:T9SS type A sorting domain-containing protein [Saprospiraceae bacterium]
MKKVLFALLFVLTQWSSLLANSGIFDNAIRIQVNGGATTEYYFGAHCVGATGGCSGSNSPTSANFDGINAGSGILSLKIIWAEVRTFKNGSDNVTGTNLFYRVYPTGGAPAFAQEGIAFGADLGGGDQRWTETLNIELTTGLLNSTAYTLEIYSTAPFTYDSGSGTHFNNASGSNFKMTFTTSAVLPVELTKFTASATNNNINLAWETASEHDNHFFEVQHATDGRNWRSIDRVFSQNGNAQYNQSYSFVDRRPATGSNYYRLRQVDIDGNFSFSNVVQVRLGLVPEVHVSPNPAGETVWLTLETTDLETDSQVQILDAYGRLLREWQFSDLNTQQAIPLDLSGLPAGLLFVRVDGLEAKRLLKQ